MPMFELTYPEGALGADARAPLVEQLTAALMRWEGAPDTDVFRQATWGYLNEQPNWAVNRAGAPADPPSFRLAVTIPGGAMSDRRKQGLVDEATKLAKQARASARSTQA